MFYLDLKSFKQFIHNYKYKLTLDLFNGGNILKLFYIYFNYVLKKQIDLKQNISKQIINNYFK